MRDNALVSYGDDAQIRQFYAHFKQHRRQFLTCIEGNIPLAERDSYGSLILCRIIFLYFLQARGLLDGDSNYLANRLVQVQQTAGPQQFYRAFLLPLFQSGLSSHTSLPGRFAGVLPELGPDLFPAHPCEKNVHGLHIPDEAFVALFIFLDQYQWCLDEQYTAGSQVINPTLWGAVAEIYINQQQMGAYYTRGDVTKYIVQYTILPYLLEKIATAYPDLLKTKQMPWLLLRQYPERYIPQTIQCTDYLPGETMSEYQTRRAHYMMLSTRMLTGNLSTIDELVTCNLDMARFLLDSLEQSEDNTFPHICYEQLRQITLLDPTCGSGAFLFAGLEILFPLYKACLMRLQNVSQEGEYRQRTDHYTILKTILERNLYGVDIMEEAVEICRLRLLLKFIAQVETIAEIQPLPELSRHLRVGNTLCESKEFPGKAVYAQLDQIDISCSQTFTWRSAFPEVFERGGFAVIVGNPPYVEYRANSFPYHLQDFKTLLCGNIYTCIIERCQQLLEPGGRQGMVLPVAAFATRNMAPFLECFLHWFPRTWLSFYHFRPAMLFSGGKIASIPTAIFLAKNEGSECRFATHLLKWQHQQRAFLFSRLAYCQVKVAPDPANRHYYPKIGNDLENTIIEKIRRHRVVRDYLAEQPGENRMFYRSAGGLYWKVFVNFPWPYTSASNKQCMFAENYDRDVFVALFNSSLFWWYYTVTFDTFNLKDYMLFGFRFTYPDDPAVVGMLRELCGKLMADFRKHARSLKRGKSDSYTIYARKAKAIIDEIDRVLATQYGFSEEELTFILGYDMKYRVGNA